MVLGRLRGCHSLSEDMLRMCCAAVLGGEALRVCLRSRVFVLPRLGGTWWFRMSKSAKGQAEVRKKAEWSRRFGFASSDGALLPLVLDLGAEKLLDPSR